MATAHEDPTRVYTSHEKPWLPIPLVPKGEAWIKVILVDEERKCVVFKFRFSEGCELPKHTHECHAIAYTVSGEWEYEGMKLPQGAVAYEPVHSTHTPSSGPGSELAVVLTSETDRFLVNHLADGSEVEFDMSFFKALEAVESEEQVQKLVEDLGAGV
jgi:quercetin dioxygenase-like cupin family protein